jgi:hypothetical protein
MNIRKLIASIDFEARHFSLLLVEPKQCFLDWVASVIPPSDRAVSRFYPPEENMVLVVPQIDFFTEPGSFWRFVDSLKPSLLRAELNTRGRELLPTFPHPVSKETFDAYFDVLVRENVRFLRDFSCPEFQA